MEYRYQLEVARDFGLSQTQTYCYKKTKFRLRFYDPLGNSFCQKQKGTKGESRWLIGSFLAITTQHEENILM